MTRKESAHRASPKAPGTETELERVARAVSGGILWTAGTIAILLGDSLSRDRKGRQRRRKEQAEKNRENETENATEGTTKDSQKPDEKPGEIPGATPGETEQK